MTIAPEEKTDKPWEKDDIAELRRHLIAQAKALDAYASGELPAPRGDVLPSRISDGEGNPRTSEYIEEGRARLAGRPVETPGRAVDVDEVDLDQGRIEKLCKRAGIRRRIVDVSQEDVFNEDALPSRPRMIVDGRDQIGARVHALDGHERGPFVGDSVGERYREAELVREQASDVAQTVRQKAHDLKDKAQDLRAQASEANRARERRPKLLKQFKIELAVPLG